MDGPRAGDDAPRTVRTRPAVLQHRRGTQGGPKSNSNHPKARNTAQESGFHDTGSHRLGQKLGATTQRNRDKRLAKGPLDYLRAQSRQWGLS